VTDLHTYVRSKEELLKTVKTRLACENGGCYRPEELRFLAAKYNSAKEKLNSFLARIERPDEELAQHFDELYAPVKTVVEAADNEIKANLASRARILFPNDNKKKTQQWVKKTLAEKLSDLSEDKLQEFMPETLPGIMALPVEVAGNVQQRQNAIRQRYARCADDERAQEVITSWFSNFDSSLEED
jgi:predicted trehalose synthase